MRNAKPFISLNDVSIRVGERVLFQGLSWEMQSDQHWAVIGPNGSGKSTLMKALCGALPVVKGDIVYHFMQGNGRHPVQDRIAYVTFESQRTVLSDEAFYQARWNAGVGEDSQSVSEFLSEQGVKRINSYHVIESRQGPDYAARRQDVIDQLELGKLLERKVTALSNGERRKVTIARALLKNPRLLILDNPFAGLDERFRSRLADDLGRLMQGDLRVLMVGTDRDAILPGFTHILSVQDSRVIAQGPRDRHVEQSENQGRPHTPSGLLPSRQPTYPPTPFPMERGAGSPFLDGKGGGGLGRRGDQGEASRQSAHHASPAGTLVHMENVSVSYNETPVLHEINWTVRENEQWALLGPNGAGKTTLLSLILADNPQAYANDITLFGRRRGSGESIWEIKRNIGWVAPELQLYYPCQATCLDVACSGWFDSVGLFRECTPYQRAIAVTWLERFGLAERAGMAFEKVSEGEQRLALLARALVKNPTLLVLDEPCQGLDAGNRDRVLQAIDGVESRPNMSMIYVTHRADELPRNITHVLRLSEGRVVEQGSQRFEDGQLRSNF